MALVLITIGFLIFFVCGLMVLIQKSSKKIGRSYGVLIGITFSGFILLLLGLANSSPLAKKQETSYQDNKSTQQVSGEKQQNEQNQKQPQEEEYFVTWVVDGDTIELENGQKVRYIGIDTPETQDPNKEVECYGRESTQENIRLIKNKKVRLEKDVSETDKYGRLLRYVYVEDTFVNLDLVQRGFARVATFPPDVKYQEKFIQAEKEAREADRGLWAPDACVKKTTSLPSTLPTTPQSTNISSTQKCLIKGNISTTSGEKIYHVPGGAYYDKTVIDESKGERWFCTEDEAKAAGWRKSKL